MNGASCVCLLYGGPGVRPAGAATSPQARGEAGHLGRVLLHDGGPPRLHGARQCAVVNAAVWAGGWEEEEVRSGGVRVVGEEEN